MSPSKYITRSTVAFLAALTALTVPALSATYTWVAEGPNQQWLNAANYGGSGTISPTNADTFIYNAGTRSPNVQANGTIGKLVIGPDFGGNIATNGTSILTIQSGGAGVTSAGIEIQSGKSTNTNVNARLNLQGDIIINNSSPNRLQLGAGEGNGGIQGTGTLSIINGVVLLNNSTAAHTYSGVVTVSNGGSLQISSNATFDSYSSLTVTSAGGGLVGGGTFGGATINGGRISPGGEGGVNSAPNTLTFSNLLTLQSNALLVLDVAATGADALATTGLGTISLGGELRLRLNNNYTDPAGGVYQLLTGALGGNFDSVTIRTQADGASSVALTDDGSGIWTGGFTHAPTGNSYDLSFNANTGELTLIPEPTHILLSSLGVMASLRRRR